MSVKLAGNHVQVIVDGYNLTGDHNQVVLDDSRAPYDVTTFGDAVRNYVLGQRNISLGHMGYMNADTARSHSVLKGITVNGAVSVLVGENDTPAVGDPAYSMAIRQGQYQTMARTGSAIPFTAVLANRGLTGGWGRILRPAAPFTNGFTSGVLAESGAAGAAVFLHVIQAAVSDSYTFQIESSDTGAFAGEETVAGTFSLNGQALASERHALAGTVPTHLRLVATRTGSAGDSVDVVATVVRF